MSRFRAPAIFCACTFLVCELLSHPFAEMGICDDWSYVLTIRLLAQTGHIIYNGWATAMIGWQLYLAAALIKVFGYSYTAARSANWMTGMATAFLMQRVFVRAGLNERNATIGTLAVALSPLYMLLSSTLMTDIGGLFAIVICIYGCLRAIQSATDRGAMGWLIFAAVSNCVFGTSRQIAWLGVLVVVPSATWLLRKRRGLLVTGVLATLAGCVFVAGAMYWFKQQPYTLSETAMVKVSSLHQVVYMARQLTREFFEVPFFLLAILVAFLPEVRRGGKSLVAVLAGAAVVYTALAIRMAPHHGADMMLVPLLGDWVSPLGFYSNSLASPTPIALGIGIRVVLTALTMVGFFCVVAFLLRIAKVKHVPESAPVEGGSATLSWTQLGILLGPFTLAYATLLIPRSTGNLIDRYALALVLVAALFLVRAYQDFVRPTLPRATVVMVAIVALFSIAATHDMFALYRARLALAKEVAAAGVPDTMLDGGFEYDGAVELEHAGHMNDPRMVNPPNSYVPADPHRGWSCSTTKDFKLDAGLLELMPRYGIAFDPDACRGPAPFGPVRYFRWLALRPTTIYVVKYGPR